MAKPDRWIQIRKTSPSGKTLFVCLSCGTETDAPRSECSQLVKVDHEAHSFYMPCSAWPKSPLEHAEELTAAEGTEAFFSGTVILPDGAPISIAVAIPEELARQIGVLGVEYDLIEGRRSRRRETQELELQKMRQPQGQTTREEKHRLTEQQARAHYGFGRGE